MTKSTIDLQNQFLIAMPRLEDPNFIGSVTYICQHNDDGAMGIVVNKTAGLYLGDIFEQLELSTKGKYSKLSVMQGGPVQLERGFVLHRDGSTWDSSYAVSNSIQLTTSKDILSALAEETGPSDFVVALGYAGWGAGQLEEEIAQNSWLTCEADHDVLFHEKREKKYALALASLGLDAAKLNGQAGHA